MNAENPLIRAARAATSYTPRSVRETAEPAPAITTPDAAVALVGAQMRAEPREVFYVLPLDTKNRPIGEPVELYRGSLNAITLRLAEVFRDAIVRHAAAVMLLHNHPSGDSTPSPEDVRLTRDAVAAGRLLDVLVLDHLVVGRTGYTSLRAAGLVGF